MGRLHPTTWDHPTSAVEEYLLHSGLVLCDRSMEIAGMEPENLVELKAECWRDIGNMHLGCGF